MATGICISLRSVAIGDKNCCCVRPAHEILIANEMRSPASVTDSQRAAYISLIANEFHLRNAKFRRGYALIRSEILR